MGGLWTQKFVVLLSVLGEQHHRMGSTKHNEHRPSLCTQKLLGGPIWFCRFFGLPHSFCDDCSSWSTKRLTSSPNPLMPPFFSSAEKINTVTQELTKQRSKQTALDCSLCLMLLSLYNITHYLPWGGMKQFELKGKQDTKQTYTCTWKKQQQIYLVLFFAGGLQPLPGDMERGWGHPGCLSVYHRADIYRQATTHIHTTGSHKSA